MIDIDKLPEPIKKEVLDFADFLLTRYSEKRLNNRTWLKDIKRGVSTGESASETVQRIRGEEKW